MPDIHALVNEFVIKLKRRKVEGSHATARQTAELLRSAISQQRLPYRNQAGALIDAVNAVGEQLISANPVELAVGNIVRRVLHIIREEDLSLSTTAIGGLSLAAGSDDEDDVDRDDQSVLSAVAVAAASRNTLRPPSLHTLLEDVPDSAAVPHTSSSGGDSEGKSKFFDELVRLGFWQYFLNGIVAYCVRISVNLKGSSIISADKSSRSRKLKHDVIEAVNELIQDIDTCHEQIAEQAVEHIHQKYSLFTLNLLLSLLSCFSALENIFRNIVCPHMGSNDLWELHIKVLS
ncbi:hypothetical protein HHK36_019604 [Tetracentron sinense]|uniref:Translation initiation factor eIF2B subunit beta n=1 Tax=Tetracentron sinense TaxID=13715 RepID=A0A834YU47_TETSI|nr:hypothetical protein HHK36_019604 [Tetracentron sinense]